jgi:molybdopterin molybdotransferase
LPGRRPGKPLLFGRLDQLPVLGFPGNPVSTAVCAIVFLRAALQTLLAMPVRLRIGKAELASELGANDQRQDYMRAMYEDDALRRRVRIAGRQDSSMLATLAHADALLVRPPHDPPLQVGDMVSIIDLREALDNLR